LTRIKEKKEKKAGHITGRHEKQKEPVYVSISED